MNTEEFTSEVAPVVEIIEKICLERKTVLGSYLGNAIKIQYPNLDMKLRYGGLRTFVQKYCTGRVIYLNAQGGDGVYAHVSMVDARAPLEPESSSTHTAWETFVNPNVHGQLAVDPVRGSLHVYSAEEDRPKEFFPVEKISLEEQRAIAKEFLAFIPIESRSLFESTLSAHDFWPKWMTAFKTLADREMFVNWMKWRHAKIIALLEQKLRSADVSNDVVVSAISEFQKSKQIKTASTKSSSVPVTTRFRRSVDDSSVSRLGAKDFLLRKLAHLAIDSMSDGDIRRIWMPLGAVNDALQRSK